MTATIKDEQINSIRQVQATIHKSNVDAGWYSDLVTRQPINRNFGELIALMHSELSEALEGWRKDLPDSHLPHRLSVEVELADALIRILDAAEYMKFDVAGAMQEKFVYNQKREDHKRENRRTVGGKKI